VAKSLNSLNAQGTIGNMQMSHYSVCRFKQCCLKVATNVANYFCMHVKGQGHKELMYVRNIYVRAVYVGVL